CMRLKESRASRVSSHKKGARSPGRCHQAGLCAPSLSHSEWFPLDRHTIIRASMSVRLVEEGLPMIPAQSCVAGPSVCATSGPSSHLSQLSLLRVDREKKRRQLKPPSTETPQRVPTRRRPQTAGELRSSAPAALALVTLCVQPIVRESPRE